MIDVLIVDDHAAVRAGLVALLRLEPGFVPIAAVEDADAALETARARNPDVALVDYHLQGSDGLSICRRLRALEAPPRVVVYSAFADERLALLAALVGAHDVVSKNATSDELFDALRAAATRRTSPLQGPRLLADAGAVVSVDDMPVLGMLSDRTPEDRIAQVLNLTEAEVARRREGIIERLKLAVAPNAAATGDHSSSVAR